MPERVDLFASRRTQRALERVNKSWLKERRVRVRVCACVCACVCVLKEKCNCHLCVNVCIDE